MGGWWEKGAGVFSSGVVSLHIRSEVVEEMPPALSFLWPSWQSIAHEARLIAASFIFQTNGVTVLQLGFLTYKDAPMPILNLIIRMFISDFFYCILLRVQKFWVAVETARSDYITEGFHVDFYVLKYLKRGCHCGVALKLTFAFGWMEFW